MSFENTIWAKHFNMTEVDFNEMANSVSLQNQLMLPGRHPFEVVKLEEAESKAGKPMMKATLKACDEPYSGKLLFVYFPSSGWGLKRYKQFTQSLGMTSEVAMSSEAPTVARGKRLICEVGLEKSEQYGEQNKVEQFFQAEKQREAEL